MVTLVPSLIHSQCAGHVQLAGAFSMQCVYATSPSSKYGIANSKASWNRYNMTGMRLGGGGWGVGLLTYNIQVCTHICVGLE